MTSALTVRLDEDTARQLAELAEHYGSRAAAVHKAIRRAWRQLQEEKLDAGYAAAAAENPCYPYESAEEAAVLHARRRAHEPTFNACRAGRGLRPPPPGRG
jgi:predicted transcriptional regulator